MNQKDFFKKILEERKKVTEERLQSIAKKNSVNRKGYTTIFPEIGRSDDENADEVVTFTNLLSLKTNLEQELKEIEDALSKIKKGTYGICEICGKKIKKNRLKANPTSRFCQNCQAKAKSL
ncbi:TraR/DksA family transcriptional regulator [bacterium]|nr:TraR/DksA family transcriptional regulator [bacterium]